MYNSITFMYNSITLNFIIIVAVATILNVVLNFWRYMRNQYYQVRHVREAIDALNLWDEFNKESVFAGDKLRRIDLYFKEHGYEQLDLDDITLILVVLRRLPR